MLTPTIGDLSPTTRGPLSTTDLAKLAAAEIKATARVASHRLGMHLDPGKGHREPATYVSVAALDDYSLPVLLRTQRRGGPNIAAVFVEAVADRFRGEVEFELWPTDHATGVDWTISAVRYIAAVES